MLTPLRFAEAGMALYGENWEGALAAKLKVSRRTVKRWATGEPSMPPGLDVVLGALLEQQVAALQAKRVQILDTGFG